MTRRVGVGPKVGLEAVMKKKSLCLLRIEQ
jgi:hypothetical protein